MKRFKSSKRSTQNRKQRLKPLLQIATVVAGALLVAGGAPQPANAYYYYPFYYRGISNLLYPLRYASYGLFGLGGPVSSWTSASPYRLATGRLTGYPYMYGPQTMMNYQDPEPYYQPRNRVKQKRLGQEFGVDEVNHAQWADGNDDARLATAPPQAVQGGYAQGATPGQISYSGAPPIYPAGAGLPTATPTQFGIPAGYSLVPNGLPTTPTPGPDGMPPTPPPMVSKGPVSLAPNAHDLSPIAAGGTPRAPLADGFVNHVNTQFGGNIETALFDPSTRKYAKVLGLVSDDNLFGMDFTNTRVELIKQIFNDTSIDSVSKLGAIKILLNGSAANSAPAKNTNGANRAK